MVMRMLDGQRSVPCIAKSYTKIPFLFEEILCLRTVYTHKKYVSLRFKCEFMISLNAGERSVLYTMQTIIQKKLNCVFTFRKMFHLGLNM